MDIRGRLIKQFQLIRTTTEKSCLPLQTEDYIIQSMPDVSPPKWHLAHTTWFFETFILKPMLANYQWHNPLFQTLFNSYYKTLNVNYFPRDQRGILARPTVKEIYAYRHDINQHIIDLIQTIDEGKLVELETLIIIGLNHEQQHQELLLMDIKYNFSIDPSFPEYHATTISTHDHISPLNLIEFAGGLRRIGHQKTSFCFDNELPAHDTYLHPFALSNRLITNGEYLEFIEAGSYDVPELWLADGWEYIHKQAIQLPLYWQYINGHLYHFTLHGMKSVHLNEPVSHISYYEADAFARWKGLRLPTEFEWESAAQDILPDTANFVENEHLHPIAANHSTTSIQQMFGDLWEWTSSAYSPYPGYKPLPGTLGEYNAKFMNNQIVLRGGSCITPSDHIRASYRNYFPQDKRWVFSGLRLAKTI